MKDDRDAVLPARLLEGVRLGLSVGALLVDDGCGSGLDDLGQEAHRARHVLARRRVHPKDVSEAALGNLIRGAGVDEERNLLALGELGDPEGDRARVAPTQHDHPVFVDQLRRHLGAGLGPSAVVGEEELELSAAHPAAGVDLLRGEGERLPLHLAEEGLGAGKRQHDADFDALLGGGGIRMGDRPGEADAEEGRDDRARSMHGGFSLKRAPKIDDRP